MNIIAFVGAGIIGAVLSSVLKQYKPEFSIYITLITGMLMLGAAVSAVKPVIETVSGYLETAVPDSSYADVLVKSLAVCYITQMASDSCSDAGEKSIASCRQVCDSHTGFAGIQQTYGGNKTTFTVRDYENSCY